MSYKLKRLQELIVIINTNNKKYYTEDNPSLQDREYDKLYDELLELEKELKIVYANSPTINVGYKIKNEFKQIKHRFPLKSLDKRHTMKEIKEFLADKEGVASLKADGLTIKITYDKELKLGVTRGTGNIGEEVTDNVKTFKNIPISVDSSEIEIIGEGIVFKEDFEKINTSRDEKNKFKNCRNLASGSVRQLNSKITSERNINFLAFGLGYYKKNFKTKIEQLEFCKSLGFTTVPYKLCNKDNINEVIEELRCIAEQKGIPFDGIVITYNDLEYGKSLGETAKFPKHSIAYKFEDKLKETILRGIEYTPSRNGILTPVAIFDKIELEGTSVQKATLKNLGNLKNLSLGIGDKLLVYKANQIIPHIEENLTRSNTYKIPQNCPICNCELKIEGVFLKCNNKKCISKLVNKIGYFVGKNGLDIKGLGNKTLQQFFLNNIISNRIDIFNLESKRDKILNLEKLQEKKYNKIINSVNESRKTTLVKFISSLGINNVGMGTTISICSKFNTIDKILNLNTTDLIEIKDIGWTVADNFISFIRENREEIKLLAKELVFITEDTNNKTEKLKDLVFVITGSFNNYKNRNEIKNIIINNGGKVTSTVTNNTNYLLNNDLQSNSEKNTKAKKLGVKIINEVVFREMLQ